MAKKERYITTVSRDLSGDLPGPVFKYKEIIERMIFNRITECEAAGRSFLLLSDCTAAHQKRKVHLYRFITEDIPADITRRDPTIRRGLLTIVYTEIIEKAFQGSFKKT